jgi:hypothetical protein
MSIHSAKQITRGIKGEGTYALPESTLDLTNFKSIARVQNKTAAYQVLETDSGTTFFTLGATGSITFTLPVPIKKGLWYRFVNSTAEDLLVAGAANTLVAYADATATSVTITNIGVMLEVICDGNSWYCVTYGVVSGAAATVT